jgi:hypothetical protein
MHQASAFSKRVGVTTLIYKRMRVFGHAVKLTPSSSNS